MDLCHHVLKYSCIHSDTRCSCPFSFLNIIPVSGLLITQTITFQFLLIRILRKALTYLSCHAITCYYFRLNITQSNNNRSYQQNRHSKRACEKNDFSFFHGPINFEKPYLTLLILFSPTQAFKT